MTLPIWLDSPGERIKDDFEVAIVGGGIIGAACAYWLSRRAGLKTVLLEADCLSGGATGRSAGFVLRGIQAYYNKTVKLYGRETARFIYRFAEESQGQIRDFLEASGKAIDYTPSGSYLLASSLEELDDLNESAELMKEDGFKLEYFKEDPIGRDFYGAIYNPDDFGLHPAKLVQALVESSACKVHRGEPVLRMQGEDHGGLSLTTPHRTVICRKVFLCTNAYTPLLEPWFKDKLEPARGQILVTQPLRKQIVERLCYANYGWEYFRQLPDRRLLLGGCRQLHLSEEVGYADIVTDSVQGSLDHYLKDRFPDVAGVSIDYRFAGLMAFTADGLPLVGELKSLPGVFFAVGCNGHGLGYGLNIARLLVDLALDGRDPAIFSVERAGLTPKNKAYAGQDKGP